MAEPISVAVRRGGTVEARHRVHAVLVRRAEIVESAGDPQLVTFMRSSAKPIQALPLARAVPDLTDAELAIASASHLADEEQLAAVRALLERAGAGEDDLECGPAGKPPARSKHNCSGKHAGMLALCRVRGWETRGYRLADHPCQRMMLAEVAAAADVPQAEIPTAVDGCGVLTFALGLERMAHAFTRLEGTRVADAMRARPELIRGPAATDTRLMRERAGWIAKGGAEGLFCAASPAGFGVALKVEDGNGRALGPAVAALLDVPELAREPVLNSRGDEVGEIFAER
jgi:L-asparaginase II